jgi:acetyltransferase-like isoleucine patch superfamily enzyme
MVSKAACRLLIIAFLAIVGCNHKRTDSEARLLLTGEWNLHIGSDCAIFDVASDKLILHSDGTFEQHTVSKRGFHYDAPAEKWTFSPENHVFLDSRKNFFNSQPSNEFVGARIVEGLIVDFRNPMVILLNPDQDCFYTKPK